MGKKLFISYKYLDEQVRTLTTVASFEKTTARHYVDEIQNMMGEGGHVNKGERDGEDLSDLADSTIGSKLGDKIFDSTVTLVLISKGMKENKSEKEQWIPWEVSYSLREQTREGQKSKTNAILAIVLPDENDDYSYFIEKNVACGSRTLKTNFLFDILKSNMFNIKKPDTRECNGSTIYYGGASYIISVKWGDFVKDGMDIYIEKALENYRNRDEFELVKRLK